MSYQNIVEQLGDQAEYLLNHECKTVSKTLLYAPSPDCIDRVFVQSNRPPQVLRSLVSMYNHGWLSRTRNLSILPIDQGIEHTAGFSLHRI